MSKSHIINLHILNNSGGVLVFSDDCFKTGRLADGNSWPATIPYPGTAQVECYESDWSPLGCSGWVEYTLNSVPIYFSFSNPVAGQNGIDVGLATNVWGNMGGHYYPVERPLQLSDGTWLNVTINSTSGDTNDAVWDVQFVDLTTTFPANIEMVNVQQVWNSLSSTGTRRYFKCDDSPTNLTGIAKSHFKGLSVYIDKLIFTHTNLGLITPNPNGKYLIADQLWDPKWDQATVGATLDTLHQGWAHPCSSQACGSFMAMGIQADADGPDSKVSEIQILDIRMTRVNQPATLLGKIPNPNDGVNGVGMTKESGPDGRYIVAGINGSMLTVYRSTTSSLITDGAPTVQFEQVFQQTIEDSGPGLALVTQQGGAIYMFALNADPGEDNNEVNLYGLDLKGATCTRIGTKHMQIPGMSDSVTLLEEYAVVLGPLAVALLAEFGAAYLNSSLRFGKGLAIRTPSAIEVYASDRNVLPLSQFPVIGSDKDFSLVTWSSVDSPWQDRMYIPFQANDSSHLLYVASSAGTATPYSGISMGSAPAAAVFNERLYIAFQANDSSHTLYVTSSADGINFTTPATGYSGISIGSAPAMAIYNEQLYIAFQANDSSHLLYVTSSADGINFTMPATGYPGIAIGGAPAMAVINGRLYIAFQADDSSQTLYITSSADGINFTTPATPYSNIAIGSAPAMAFFNGKLYIAFQANDSSHLLYVTSSADGINFTMPATGYPGIAIGGAPAMAVINGRLYIAFQADDSSQTLYITSSADGINFTTPATPYSNIAMGSAPAMAEFWGLVR